MDQKQWSAWVATQLEGKRASKALNDMRYKEFFQGVAPSVSVTAAQVTTRPPTPREQTTLVGAVTTGGVMGPRKHNTTLQLDTAAVQVVERVDLPDPRGVTQTLTRQQKHYRKQRKRRTNPVISTRQNALQRKRRMLSVDRFKNMSADDAHRISIIDNVVLRNDAKKKWLRKQTTQTQLDEYPAFIQHTNRALALEIVSTGSRILHPVI